MPRERDAAAGRASRRGFFVVGLYATTRADELALVDSIDLAYVPLFADSRKTTWYLELAGGDKRYADALRQFVIATVQAGQYDTFYRKAFGKAPSYDPLSPLLLPRPG